MEQFKINVSNTNHIRVDESFKNNHGIPTQQTKLSFDKNNCVKQLHSLTQTLSNKKNN